VALWSLREEKATKTGVDIMNRYIFQPVALNEGELAATEDLMSS
jgi:hypothetical protein